MGRTQPRDFGQVCTCIDTAIVESDSMYASVDQLFEVEEKSKAILITYSINLTEHSLSRCK